MSVRDCVQCDAITKKGTRCTRNTCKYPKQCFQHARKSTGLSLQPSSIPGSGVGLFSMKRIKKNQIISPYTGVNMTKQAYSADRSGYGVYLPGNRVLDARSTQSSMARYANSCRTTNKNQKHCPGNNAKLAYNARQGTYNLKATKVIPAGREVFASYGQGFWR